MLSLAMVTLSPSSPAISSSAGAIIRHGPHHSAQKSTRTGLSEPRTSEAKLWSVTVLVVMAGESPERIQVNIHMGVRFRALKARVSNARLDEFRTGRVQERSGDFPS